MHLCPVDLRKLQQATGFNILDYYQKLYDVCRSMGFVEEQAWLNKRLEKLRDPALK
jgi:hypothetical protein